MQRRFKDSHPTEFDYFTRVLTQSMATEPDEEERSVLSRALEDLATVSVVKVCPCGEPGCATFNFTDYSQVDVETRDCVLLDGIEDTVVIEFDGSGNLIGVEKVPDGGHS